MRHSVVLGKDSEMELKNLTIGQVVRGTVHRITDFGVFVAIDDTSLVGLSRKAMAVPSETTDLKEVYSVGGHVRAKILGIAGSKISLGLKSSYFKETTTGNDESGDENDDEEEEEDDHVAFADDDSDEEEIQKLINEAALHSDSEEEGDEDEDEEEDEESDEGESVDDNDEGLPMKKQKVLDGRAVAAVVISSNTSGLSSAKSSRDSGCATPSTPSSSLNPFAQQSNMMLWGSSFEPSVTTKEGQENEKSESEGDDGSDSENEENNGKRKRNRNSTALKAEEEIRKKEVSHYLNPPPSFSDSSSLRMLLRLVSMSQLPSKILKDCLSRVPTPRCFGSNTCLSSCLLRILMLPVLLG
jgi:predicted RNA-binding protein with RPS1 domain